MRYLARTMAMIDFLGVLLSLISLPVLAQTGNAEVTRTKNLQYFELEYGDVDVTRIRNLQSPELISNNADVTRLGNLQHYELEPNNADVTRTRNMQFFELSELTLASYILSLVITDQDGTPEDHFSPGDVVQFNVTVKNIGNSDLTKALVSMMIFDPSNTSILLSYVFQDLFVGQSKQIIFGYRIPLDALTGSYMTKIMVFTDWPSKGGVGLDIKTQSFFVG
ncbi:MAG: hypothetical protein ACTSV7_11425 [Candidatus Baldrarchaeia archaeon]